MTPSPGLPFDDDRAVPLSVSELTADLKQVVEQTFGRVLVEGEISNCKQWSSGHIYFTLKDDRAQIRAVIFRMTARTLRFKLEDGLRVVIRGRVSLYEVKGEYQVICDTVEPQGLGALQAAFEQLKRRLQAEGLFEAARKRPLPVRPRTVAVITSPTGAVWQDVCTVLSRRWPLTRVVLVAARVQGDGAPASIVTAFRRLERWIATAHAEDRPDDAPALTILARGGGSLEDLWAFNDEHVVRAVVAHTVPVVCGVGHEVDVTLADFAADVRAATPSAAAEIVVPDRAEFAAKLATMGRRLATGAAGRVGAASREVLAERRALDRLSPTAQLAMARERSGLLLDRATRAVTARVGRDRGRIPPSDRLDAAVRRRTAAARSSLDSAGAALDVLAPQRTLDRGYAIVRRTADGTIVRDPTEAPAGTRLAVRVAAGELPATVDPS
jgi:exodeoxyribonuclease VII large subunit